MNMLAVANSSLSGVRVSVRELAVSDLHYFAEHVLGCKYPAELCEEVQEAIEVREDISVRCTYPKQFAQALSAWLSALGYNVLGTEPLRHDILHWLELDAVPGAANSAVVIDLLPIGVTLKWL